MAVPWIKNLENYSIYTCDEPFSLFLEEKFQQPIEGTITHFVWRSINQSLGFENDAESKEFVRELIKDKFTIMFPELKVIPDENGQLNQHWIRGVTFFSDFEEIKQEHGKLINYHIETKRNLLHKRYNKPTIQVYEPFILRWYDKPSHKYTIEFTDYVLKNKLKFIIWASSDWGTHIYTYTVFADVIDDIRNLADNLNIQVNKVADVRHMPNY